MGEVEAVDKPCSVIPSLSRNPMKSALQKGIPQSLTLNRNDISDFFDTLNFPHGGSSLTDLTQLSTLPNSLQPTIFRTVAFNLASDV